MLLGALLGVVIQNGILRFMRGAAPLVRLVATLGVLIVLQGLAGQKLWDNDFHQVDQFLPTHNYTLHEWFGFNGDMGRVVVQQDRLILLGIAIVLDVRAVGLHPLHADRAGDLRERGERAGRGCARVVTELPGHGHVGHRGRRPLGLAGILLAPNAGLSLTVFTIVVTVSALAVALIGGFSSFPLTLLGGIALGHRRDRGAHVFERHLDVPPRHARDRERCDRVSSGRCRSW